MEMKSGYFVHESSYVDDNVTIGAGTKIWYYSHIQSGARIGEGCSIGQNVNIGNNVVIGNGVKIQNNVSVYEGVELEDHVFCGPSAVFTNINRPRSEFPQKGSDHYVKTVVKKGATLGANCTIICGITIGEYALIGAGAVVTKDIPHYALVVGNPGKVVGEVDKKGNQIT
jgi:UDP-2-acetamido-3-amino-2,3-dideoxy-glucuronate N-acetyltransferase